MLNVGIVVCRSYPDMKLLYTQPAHSSNCICIEFDRSGQYFATGSADALMSLWDTSELCCLMTFSRYAGPYSYKILCVDGRGERGQILISRYILLNLTHSLLDLIVGTKFV
mgnify:CR=1 FL=1